MRRISLLALPREADFLAREPRVRHPLLVGLRHLEAKSVRQRGNHGPGSREARGRVESPTPVLHDDALGDPLGTSWSNALDSTALALVVPVAQPARADLVDRAVRDKRDPVRRIRETDHPAVRRPATLLNEGVAHSLVDPDGEAAAAVSPSVRDVGRAGQLRLARDEPNGHRLGPAARLNDHVGHSGDIANRGHEDLPIVAGAQASNTDARHRRIRRLDGDVVVGADGDRLRPCRCAPRSWELELEDRRCDSEGRFRRRRGRHFDVHEVSHRLAVETDTRQAVPGVPSDRDGRRTARSAHHATHPGRIAVAHVGENPGERHRAVDLHGDRTIRVVRLQVHRRRARTRCRRSGRTVVDHADVDDIRLDAARHGPHFDHGGLRRLGVEHGPEEARAVDREAVRRTEMVRGRLRRSIGTNPGGELQSGLAHASRGIQTTSQAMFACRRELDALRRRSRSRRRR